MSESPRALPGVLIAALLLVVYLVPAASLGFWEPWETSLATLGRYIATTEGVSVFAPLRDGALVGKSWLETVLLTIGYRLGSGSELGFRMPIVVLSVGSAVYAYAVLARWFGWARAAAAALLFGVMPLTLLSSASLAGDAAYAAVLTATLLTAGVACAEESSRAWSLPLLGVLLAGCFWGHGFIGLGFPLSALALFAVGARDDTGRASFLSLLAGGLLILAGAGLPLSIVLAQGWGAGKDALGVGITTAAPLGLLVAAAPSSRARGLLHLTWTPVAALLFAAGVLIPFRTLLAASDLTSAVQHLLYEAPLAGRVLPAHVTFDVLIRLVGGSAFPLVMFVPFGYAYLFRTLDGDPRDTRDADDGARAVKQLLIAWTATGFLISGLALSLSGQVTFAIGLPMAASVALALGDTRYWSGLSRDRSSRHVAGLATLFLLVVTIKDLRGTFNLELGRPGPHVLFEPLLTDGRVDFPKTYVLEHIKLFFVAWAAIAVFTFWDLFGDAERAGRVAAELRGVRRTPVGRWLQALAAAGRSASRGVFRGMHQGGVALAAFTATMAIWALHVAIIDLPGITNHLSQKGLMDTFRARAEEGTALHVAGIDEDDNSYYLSDSNVARLDRVADIRSLFCGAEGRAFVVVPFSSLAEAHNAVRRADPDSDLCPEGGAFHVIDGRSTRYVLASNQLLESEGETEQSAITANVFTRETLPSSIIAPAREVIAGERELRLVGYEITPASLDHGPLQVATYWEVLKTPTAAWEVFIHVDFRGERLNGDHQPVGNLYPTRWWVPGEIVRDTHEVEVSRADRAGTWTVFYGFFRGDTRMEMTNAESDKRLRLGAVEIR